MPPHNASMDSNSLMNPYRNRIAADEMHALRGSPRATDRIDGQLSWRRDVVRGGPLPPSEKTRFRRQNLGLRAFSHASCQGVMAPFRSGSSSNWVERRPFGQSGPKSSTLINPFYSFILAANHILLVRCNLRISEGSPWQKLLKPPLRPTPVVRSRSSILRQPGPRSIN